MRNISAFAHPTAKTRKDSIAGAAFHPESDKIPICLHSPLLSSKIATTIPLIDVLASTGNYMKFNIIGAGRLGKNIALALINARLAKLQSVCNLTPDTAYQFCKDLGLGISVSHLEDLPEADITWITCNDDSIQTIVSDLASKSMLKSGSLAIHCSGVLDSRILEPLKAQGCFIASFHPLKAFKTGYLDPDSFHNVDCVLEGDDIACSWLQQSFTQLGANIITIAPQAKPVYHAAACMSLNYLITLASCSEQLFCAAGIPREQARLLLRKLMYENLNSIEDGHLIGESLTGPIMRGDIGTLEMHLKAIENPAIQQLYKAAGLASLPLTHLSEDKKQMIAELLNVSRETT